MAKRLIDADALEADLKRQYNEVYGNARRTVNPDDFYIDRVAAYNANVVEAEQKGFFEYLKTRPTVDAAEVVRCRDCRHMEVVIGNSRWCNAWDGINGMGDDGYCNYGEKGGLRDGKQK